jgi:uncharacterized protein YkwD
MLSQGKLFPSKVILGVILTAFLLSNCGRGDTSPMNEGRATSASTPTTLGLSDSGSSGSSDVLQAAISTSADALINGINLKRAQDGLLPWVVEPILVDFAHERAVDMAVQGYLDHVEPGESKVLVEAALHEQGFFGQAAELVFATEGALQEVASITLDAWFEDIDHRVVLLSPDFRYAGLGLMGDGTRWVVTLILVEGRP